MMRARMLLILSAILISLAPGDFRAYLRWRTGAQPVPSDGRVQLSTNRSDSSQIKRTGLGMT